MQKLAGVIAAFVLASPLVTTTAQAQSADAQIGEAVQILPSDLRSGATVVTYDKTTGARNVLMRKPASCWLAGRWIRLGGGRC